jgi:hypothetical protein
MRHVTAAGDDAGERVGDVPHPRRLVGPQRRVGQRWALRPWWWQRQRMRALPSCGTAPHINYDPDLPPPPTPPRTMVGVGTRPVREDLFSFVSQLLRLATEEIWMKSTPRGVRRARSSFFDNLAQSSGARARLRKSHLGPAAPKAPQLSPLQAQLSPLQAQLSVSVRVTAMSGRSRRISKVRPSVRRYINPSVRALFDRPGKWLCLFIHVRFMTELALPSEYANHPFREKASGPFAVIV